MLLGEGNKPSGSGSFEYWVTVIVFDKFFSSWVEEGSKSSSKINSIILSEGSFPTNISPVESL